MLPIYLLSARGCQSPLEPNTSNVQIHNDLEIDIVPPDSLSVTLLQQRS